MRNRKFLQPLTALLFLFALFGAVFASPAVAQISGDGDVDFVINGVPSNAIDIGDTFTATVQVQAGSQQIDLAEVYLSFDETILQVNSLSPKTTDLPVVLVTADFDNSDGTVEYGAGKFSAFPSGTFDLIDIEFEAIATGTSNINFIDPAGAASTIATFGGANVLGDAIGTSVDVQDENNNPTNVPPTADAGDDQTVEDTDENGSESITLDGSGSSDSDGSIVSYSWVEDGNEIATGESPSVTLDVGSYTITLTVTDDEGATDTDTVSITVEAPDDPPPTGTVDLDVTPSNSTVTQGDTFTLTVETDTSGQDYDLVEVYLSFDPAVLQIVSLTPSSNLTTVLVPASFDNTAGTIEFGGGVLGANATITTDLDVLEIVFQATGAGSSAVEFVDPSGPASTIITASGTDVLGVATNASVTVNEAPSNTAPIANAGANASITLPTDTVTLDGSATDDGLPNGTLTYAWSVTSGDVNDVSFADDTDPTTDVTFATDGTYTLTLTVSDGELSDTDDVDITVSPEPQGDDVFLVLEGPQTNPVVGDTFDVTVEVQAGTQEVDTGEIHLDFDPTFLQITDVVAGSTLSVSLQNTFDNVAGTFDYAAGTFSATLPSGTFDLVTITFQAQVDGQTQIDLAPDAFPRDTQVVSSGVDVLDGVLGEPVSLTIEATASNVAPTADAGDNQTVEDGDNNGSEDVTLDGSGSSDVDGTIESYVWTVGGNQIATGATPTVSLDVGTTEITLTVTDNEGATDTDTVSITVNEPVSIDDVFIVTLPDTNTVAVGQSFDVTIQVQAGDQSVDAAEIHLDFDPVFLEITATETHDDPLGTPLTGPDFDNVAGTFDYAAGTFTQPFPTGTFDLVTITFTALQTTSNTDIAIAPLAFPRETQVTFNGNNVLTEASGASVEINETATLSGSVDLQGRQPAPNASWSIPLTVNLYEEGTANLLFSYTPTTDDNGDFVIENVPPGTYDIAVKNEKTLQVVETVTLTTGDNSYDFGLLLAGDANNDNLVTLQDFSILTGSFNLGAGDPGYDDRADLNENNLVTLADFSLLTSNFNTAGEEPGAGATTAGIEPLSATSQLAFGAIPAPTLQSLDDAQWVATNAEEDQIVDLVFTPSVSTVSIDDDSFIVDVYVMAGDQEVDGAEVHITFNPLIAEVVNLTVGTELDISLVTATFNNTAGTIDYSAGTLGDAVTGDFLLLRIEFDPVGVGTTDLLFVDPVGAPSTIVTFGGESVLRDAITGQIIVRPAQEPNEAPVAVDDSYTMDENTSLNGNVTDNDSDPNGDPLTVTLFTTVTDGQLTLNSDGSFTYTPDEDFTGTDSFSYILSDGVLDDAASVEITVNNVNEAPVAVDDNYVMDEDTVLNGNVTDNDSDPDGDALSVSLLSDVSNGNLTLNSDGSFTYTPDADYNGADSFSYTLSDGDLTDTATVDITVNDVEEPNQAPVAVDDSYVMDEDTVLNGNVTDNDSDPDGDALSVSLLSDVSNGTLNLNSDGSFTYTPNADYFGADSFSYTLSDGELTDPATVDITVNDVEEPNQAPVAVDDSYVMDEDTVLNGNVTDNDSDPDGDELTVSLLSDVSNGSLTLNSDGSFTYTPDADYNGADSFSYTLSDGELTDTAIVDITVNDVEEPNQGPVAVDDAYTMDEDTVLNGNVTDNDSDPDGDALSVSLLSDVSNGNLVLNSDGSFTYTPDADYNGADSFSYTLSDGDLTDTADVTITVNDVEEPNQAPVAVDDSYTMDEDTVLNGNVTDNDSDPDGDALSVSLLSDVSNGSLVLNSDGSFTYTPDADYFGADSFSYTLSDGDLTDTATVDITVNDVEEPNQAPVAVDDNYVMDEDTVLNGNVTDNDSDPDGDALSVSLLSDVSNGNLVLNSDGSFTYTPDADYNGADSFSYTLSDGDLTDTADVTITVNDVDEPNQAPVAVDDSYVMDEDTVLNGNVTDNDSDPDGDALSVSLLSDVSNGNLTLNSDGSFTYTPDADYFGADSFSYTLSDGDLTDTATVTITVNDVDEPNQAPVAVDDNYVMDEDTVLNGNVTDNDSDPDGDELTVSLLSDVSNGNLTLNSDGSFTYTPDADYNGADSFSYTLSDGDLTDTADVTITVNDVEEPNQAPVAVDDSYTMDEDTSLTDNVITNDSDPDGDALSASLLETVSNGTLIFNGNGDFTYVPTADFNGVDSFTYTLSDGDLTDTATVTITVNDVEEPNQAPVAVDDSYVMNEDTVLNGNVTDNDSDPDGDALSVSLLSDVSNGNLTLNSDGSFIYTPDADYFGVDSFSYTLSDGDLTDTATVTITINDVAEPNQAPVAVDDSYTMDEDTVLPANVTDNDSDPDGDALSVSLLSDVSNGTLSLNSDGRFTYTPDADYFGVDSFSYTLSDGSLTDTATVTITVTDVEEPNQEPVANDDFATTDEDTAVVINVLLNDSDPDGDSLVINSASDPDNGSTVVNANNTITYTPDAGFFGTDTFMYRVHDGNGGFDAAMVTVTVNEDDSVDPTPTPTVPPSGEAQDLEVCWIENPNGNTSSWQITNPNTVPLIAGTQQKVVYSWEVLDADGEVLQSAERWDQTGETRVNTVLGETFVVTWYIFDNSGLSDPLGTIEISATEEYRCETDEEAVETEAPEQVEPEVEVTPTPEASATPVPEATEEASASPMPETTEVAEEQ